MTEDEKEELKATILREGKVQQIASVQTMRALTQVLQHRATEEEQKAIFELEEAAYQAAHNAAFGVAYAAGRLEGSHPSRLIVAAMKEKAFEAALAELRVQQANLNALLKALVEDQRREEN